MSVTSATLSFNGTTGSRSHDGKREYTAAYLVKTDSALDQAATIINYFQNAGNLPYLGSTYSYANDNDPAATCIGIDPRRVDRSTTSWIVTLKYSTPTGDRDQENQTNPDRDSGQDTDDPTRWREQWTVGFTQTSEAVETAIYRGGMVGANAIPIGVRTPVVNSAREPFVPPPEVELEIMVVQRSFYKENFNAYEALRYQGRVNANDILLTDVGIQFACSAPATTLRVKSLGGTLEYINGFPVWRHNYEFWINPRSWRIQVADRGLNRFAAIGYDKGNGSTFTEDDVVPGRTRHFPILDADGNPIREPVLFDGAGGPLITAEITPSPVYLTYSIYEEVTMPDFLFREVF